MASGDLGAAAPRGFFPGRSPAACGGVLHTLRVWAREDGVRLDRILLTTDDEYVPEGSGPPESPKVAGLGASGYGDMGLASLRPLDYAVLNDPALLSMAPLLMLLAPLGGRRKKRRWALLVSGVLLVLSFGLTGTVIADSAEYTAPATPQAPRLALYAATATANITYTYDPLYRLTAADYASGEFFHYTYDAAGNRLQLTRNGSLTTTYQYDAANRLTTVGGVTYTYDHNGNLLSDGSRSLTYDTANRLTQVVSGTLTTQYTYAGDGVRLAQTVNGDATPGGATRYAVDRATPPPQVLVESQIAGGQSQTYLYGLGVIGSHDSGQPAPSGVEGWAYQHPDALGSVRQLTDEAGQVTQARFYSPFGVPTVAVGTPAGSFGFAGEQRDAASGLIFLRARYYDPALGRFLTRDPYPAYATVPGTLHRYIYVGDNPVNRVDPSGLQWAATPRKSPTPRRAASGRAAGRVGAPQRGGRPSYRPGLSNPQAGAVMDSRFSGAGSSRWSYDMTQAAAKRAQGLKRTNVHTRDLSAGKRPDDCGPAGGFLGGLWESIKRGTLLSNLYEWGRHEYRTNPLWHYRVSDEMGLRIAVGAAIIVTAVILTGGAALVPILIGAGIGAGIGYGAQVYHNLKQDASLRAAWSQKDWKAIARSTKRAATDIDWGAVAWASFQGAVSGAIAGTVSYFLPSGGAGILETAVTELAEGRLETALINVALGRDWEEGLWDPMDIALDVLPGVGAQVLGSLAQRAWRVGRRLAQGAWDVSVDAIQRGRRLAGSLEALVDPVGARLRNLDALTGGPPRLRGDDLRRALAGGGEQLGLAKAYSPKRLTE
jgi:RHS repeat-associated protein